jgi:tetratricopeptide (TPR) repeat protein
MSFGPFPGRRGSTPPNRRHASPVDRLAIARSGLRLIAIGCILVAAPPARAHQPLADDIARASERIASATDPASEVLTRGELHRLAGHFPAARADYDRAASLNPNLRGLDLCRAALLVDERRWSEALPILDHVLEHDPGESRAWKLRARANESLGRPAEAAVDLARAIAASRHLRPDLFTEQARLLNRAGRPAEALAALEQGVARLGPVVALELRAADIEETLRLTAAATARRNRVAAQLTGLASSAPSASRWPEPATAPSQETPATSLADPIVTRGPYLQIGTSSSITIRWRTDVATTSRVLYGTSLGNLDQSADDPTSTTEHEVRLSGLAPETRYYYAIGSTTQTLEGDDAAHTFVTAPVPGTVKPTRIWVVGDAGTGTTEQARVRDAFVTYTGARPADVWLMLGDNAYSSGTDSEYQRGCFDMYEALLKTTVSWPTRGNHDALHSGANNDYYDIFSMPTAGQAGGLASGTEAYYSFDYGNVHFICLDSEGTNRGTSDAMATWLRNDIAATPRDWVIAFWHHPPYSKGSHDSDNISDSGGRMRDMRENILPILETAGVDLVLTGHSHSYERSFLLDGHYGLSSTFSSAMKLDAGDGRETGDGAYEKPSTGTAAHEGAVYAVAGSSGKTSSGSLDHPAMFYSVRALGSMVMDVQGHRLDAVFLDDRGAILDRFTILKGGGSAPDTTPPAAITDLSISLGGPSGAAEPTDRTR